MYIAPDLPGYVCRISIQYSIPAILLIATPRGSVIRYLSLPFLVWLGSFSVYPVPGASLSRCLAISWALLGIVQAAHLLLISPMDKQELSNERPMRSKSTIGLLYNGLEALSMTRAVDTHRRVKNVPPQPAYYQRYGAQIHSARFCLRQSVIIAWQYIVMDIFQTIARQEALKEGYQPELAPIDWIAPVDVWIERAISNLIFWFILSRVLIDVHFRILSVIWVLLLGDSPANWPPAFGRMANTYTIRGFWGCFWHQFLRQPLTAVSNFVARDVLLLPRPSVLERYTNIFTVFLLSAILHRILDYVQTIPSEYSGAMPFFLSMVLGVMIEDGVQEVWRRIESPLQSQLAWKDPPVLWWQRMIGHVWVTAWLATTSTLWFNPMSQLPKEETTLVPFSISERLSIPVMGNLALFYGIFLHFVFATEV